MVTADITLDTLSQRLRTDARAKRYPLSALFELTPTCNLRCQFCYVALDPYTGPYLSTEQVCRILDKLEQAGILWLTLTGGEILSRRDFPEIYRYAKAKGFLVTLFTNATMVSEKTIALFREAPPFSVEVSIYGHTAEYYERTTQIPGSFKRFERGIALLQGAGIPLVLKVPISSITHEHLADLTDYAQARGLRFKVDMTIDARHDGGQEPTLFRITPKRVLQLVDQMADINARVGVTPVPKSQKRAPLPDCAPSAPATGPEELYRCSAGRTGFFINANGEASHCVVDRDPAFPMLEMSFEEMWTKMGAWVTQPLPKEAPCSGCGLRQSCGNCPARSRMATGSPYLKDTYYCDISHEQAGLPPAVHPDYRVAPRPLGACAS